MSEMNQNEEKRGLKTSPWIWDFWSFDLKNFTSLEKSSIVFVSCLNNICDLFTTSYYVRNQITQRFAKKCH